MRTILTPNYADLGDLFSKSLTATRVAAVVSAALFLGLSACGQQTESHQAMLDDHAGAQPSVAGKVNQEATVKTAKDISIWPQQAPAINVNPELEQKIATLLATMTLEQKVAQMIQPEIRDITVEDMRKYGFGSYLNGGGAYPNNDKHATPADWIALAERFYQASIDDSLDGSSIPTMWGTDAVHGHNNVIGATLFPHNIGLGAADNPKLIEQIAAITAKEVMVTGIDWVFAPTVAVVRDDRWGRTYEGYSEDPRIVRDYSFAIVEGLQGAVGRDFLTDQHVLSTVKHFLGDGGTEKGVDQGNNIASEQDLYAIHAQGYVGGLSAGAQSVMASFNSWNGEKIHGNKYLLTDVLKGRFGFDGFVVGDWNGHGQVDGCTNESCAQAVNAGLDIFMVPTAAWKPLYQNTIEQVKRGEIALSRIDDAVSRILRVKFRAGLFDKPSPAKRPLSGKTELIGQQSHREVARQAVRESLVLLKNNQSLLPLSPKLNVLVAGDAADNIGKQSGGWTITWQGTDNQNSDFPGASSIFAGIKTTVDHAGGIATLSVNGDFDVANKPDVAIVVFGEEPYAEGNGDIDNLEYQRGDKRDLALLKKLASQGIPVVSVFISGRPMWVNAEFNQSDAFVAAWLPGSEGNGVADVLFTNAEGKVQYDFKGKLSFSWPATPQQTTVNRPLDDGNHLALNAYSPLLPYGYGLGYQSNISEHISLEGLSEDNLSSTQTLEDLALFERAVKSPWSMFIATATEREGLSSSVASNSALTIRTMDRVVQEDARLVKFNGTELGTVGLLSNFPRDFRAFSDTEAALSLSIKVDNDLTLPLWLGMGCEGECRPKFDIAGLVKPGEWQNISVSLSCFNQDAMDFSKIVSPFYIATSAKVQLSFSDVVIQAHHQNNTVQCD
ncbi:glucan 1,4-beta-glucosidase [Shewanella aestuarii]|uniref:Exo 1,3/1,4-beta-D-glucan glucohydrolase n=2 Tax=Shewanella aestuarii TaxID=1028752 RepID=A0ABT0KW80_9GAMM|nr:exo 1,3/1,4-beta-D-glucan glucohydrolase [Shewanella aestuarii]MCL1115719.1 exo 1,3/1,4-beta-D-glucan glucohydrolase [Shewanella aestuarii]GGN68424.1 glucan 1,4-beta-glucosidase [Shewanella aestuarii]